MRVFIAVDIDEEIKKALGDLQQQLQNKAGTKKGDVTWVQPDNTHLTLKFLGEVADKKVAKVCEIVKEVAAGCERFELDIEEVGCFGGKSARVVWVGTGQGSDKLCELQADIDRRLGSVGWPKEKRKFTGHLTLARIRRPQAGVILAQMAEDYKELKLGTISVDSVYVYQSELTPQGPIYTRLGSYTLQ